MMWVIAIVLILIVFAFLKFEHFSKIWRTSLVLLLMVIIFFSMTAMIQSGKMDFSSPKTTLSSFAVYFSWLGETSLKVFDVGKDAFVTVGNVIKNNQTQQN